MFQKVTKTFQFGAHTVQLETGEIARQADGSVLVSMDDTVVLATVVAAGKARPGQDFFPLTVDYVEKTYAAGRIPGGFFKREGRPSEKEVLTSRLIDRPIRPLFPDGFYNEVQVVLGDGEAFGEGFAACGERRGVGATSGLAPAAPDELGSGEWWRGSGRLASDTWTASWS